MATSVSIAIGHTPNYATVYVGPLRLDFSYQTCIAFDSPNDFAVRRNAWGPTTGKHLNAIDGGGAQAKTLRVDGDEFKRRLAAALAPLSYVSEETEPDYLPATVENMRKVGSNGADGILAYSFGTGEEYSANPADYWNMQPDLPLTDSEGDPMVLIHRVTELRPATVNA